MKNLALLSALAALTSTAAFSYDSDPGYSPHAYNATELLPVAQHINDPGYGPHAYYAAGIRKSGPTVYYKPTMRYYGKGYTVTYRFVQWDAKANRSGLSGFEGQQYQLPAAAIQTTVASGPRVTYFSPSARPQSPAVAPETRVAGDAKALPPIGERVRK